MPRLNVALAEPDSYEGDSAAATEKYAVGLFVLHIVGIVLWGLLARRSHPAALIVSALVLLPFLALSLSLQASAARATNRIDEGFSNYLGLFFVAFGPWFANFPLLLGLWFLRPPPIESLPCDPSVVTQER